MMAGNVLVSGAAGFIGRALCLRLAGDGWKVRAIARRRSNTAVPAGVEFVPVPPLGDIKPDDPLFTNVDCAIHLAGCAHSGMPAAERERVFAADAEMTRNFAGAAAESGVRRFIFVSTAKVLGEETPPDRPFTNDSIPSPCDEYSRYKLAAEDALRDVAGVHGMEWVVVRPVLVYGPGAKGNLASLMRWLSRGYPLPLGGLANRRSLLALSDLNALLEQCISSPAAAGQRLLAAADDALSTAEICTALAEGLDRKARLLRMPAWAWATLRAMPFASGKVRRLAGSFVVDNARTRALTGWRPQRSTREGLADMAGTYMPGNEN